MTTENKSDLSQKCGDLIADIQSNGNPITSVIAIGYVANYLNGINDAGGNNHDFGYLFGLDKVDTFRGQITTYNAGKPANEQIQGLRIYLGRKLPVKAGEVIPMEKIMDSVFLMPVLADGNDLYKVHPFLGDEVILGDPRPCPNECKDLSFLSA